MNLSLLSLASTLNFVSPFFVQTSAVNDFKVRDISFSSSFFAFYSGFGSFSRFSVSSSKFSRIIGSAIILSDRIFVQEKITKALSDSDISMIKLCRFSNITTASINIDSTQTNLKIEECLFTSCYQAVNAVVSTLLANYLCIESCYGLKFPAYILKAIDSSNYSHHSALNTPQSNIGSEDDTAVISGALIKGSGFNFTNCHSLSSSGIMFSGLSREGTISHYLSTNCTASCHLEAQSTTKPVYLSFIYFISNPPINCLISCHTINFYFDHIYSYNCSTVLLAPWFTHDLSPYISNVFTDFVNISFPAVLSIEPPYIHKEDVPEIGQCRRVFNTNSFTFNANFEGPGWITFVTFFLV